MRFGLNIGLVPPVLDLKHGDDHFSHITSVTGEYASCGLTLYFDCPDCLPCRPAVTELATEEVLSGVEELVRGCSNAVVVTGPGWGATECSFGRGRTAWVCGTITPVL